MISLVSVVVLLGLAGPALLAGSTDAFAIGSAARRLLVKRVGTRVKHHAGRRFGRRGGGRGGGGFETRVKRHVGATGDNVSARTAAGIDLGAAEPVMAPAGGPLMAVPAGADAPATAPAMGPTPVTCAPCSHAACTCAGVTDCLAQATQHVTARTVAHASAASEEPSVLQQLADAQ
jgi:hypothetical protein